MFEGSAWKNLVITGEIGAGAFSTVYSVSLDGHVYALKHICIPQPQRERASSSSTEEAQNLLNEIRILQRLRNRPNIVAIRDYCLTGSEKNRDLFILMELLEPLPRYQSTHDMQEADVIRLGIDLCQALEACERHSILHRDLKPDNILVAEDGTFKVCDFGISRIADYVGHDAGLNGTFSYMAPEVRHGKPYGKQADIYSLGLILYRAMNRGREPFLSQDSRFPRRREKEDALARRMAGEALPPPVNASEAFSRILLKACAYIPKERYASASDMKKDLIRLQKRLHKLQNNKLKSRYASISRQMAFLIALTASALVYVGGKAALYTYREYFVNYCDTDMQEAIMERYHCTLGSRLNGNGVLYLETYDDLYAYNLSSTPTSVHFYSYPWMNQKKRIRKIVFGENVSEFVPEPDVMNTDLRSDSNVIACVNIFLNCTDLEEIVIRSKTFRLFTDLCPFLGGSQLTYIQCAEDADIQLIGNNPFSETKWGRAEGFRMLGTTLVTYNGTAARIEGIPVRAIRIAAFAFANNKNIFHVSLPENVQVIDASAFRGCSRLKTVSLPDSLCSIANSAFENCTELTSITLPGSVTEIGDNAFSGCSALKDIYYMGSRKDWKALASKYSQLWGIDETQTSIHCLE